MIYPKLAPAANREEQMMKAIRGSLAESHVLPQYPMSGIAIDITTPPAAHV